MSRFATRVSVASRLCVAVAAIAIAIGAPAPISAATRAKKPPAQPVKLCSFWPVIRAGENRSPPLVRSAPSLRANVIGRMTHERSPTSDEFRGVDIMVTAISGDWVRIDAVKGNPEYGIAAVPAGWIEVQGIYFVMQTSAGFSRPDAKSKRVLSTDDWVYRDAIVSIHDCAGDWLKLTFKRDSKRNDGKNPTLVTAWFRGFCGNAETTCDGVVGD